MMHVFSLRYQVAGCLFFGLFCSRLLTFAANTTDVGNDITERVARGYQRHVRHAELILRLMELSFMRTFSLALCANRYL